MKIVFHKNFDKKFKKLPKHIKIKAIKVIASFAKNPLSKPLNNHKLNGKLSDKRSISVTDNIRIVFEEQSDYILVLMLDIGTHSQVY